MKNFENTIDEIYEFFDEVIGSIVPGLYFCSYIFFIIQAIVFVFDINIKHGNYLDIIFVLCISYVIGTMFRRSNSREPDYKSAKYIYYKSCPHDDNDYAFGKLASNKIYNSFIKDFKVLARDTGTKYNKNIVLYRHSNIEMIKTKVLKKSENHSILSKPYVFKYVYKLLKHKLEKLEKNKHENKKTIKRIKKFIKKYELDDYKFIYVDYPYNNLNQYLQDRNLKYLAKYANWDMNDDSLTTKRSKSMICNMKLDIRHKSHKDYGQLLKTEAHIRFMNAMWYSNKTLVKLIAVITAISGIFNMVFFAVVNYKLLNKLYSKNTHFGTEVKQAINTIKMVFEPMSPIDGLTNKVIISLMVVFFISIVYLIFWYLIKTTIINNFHYQRIREVVSVLHLHYLINQDEKINFYTLPHQKSIKKKKNKNKKTAA